MDTAHWELRISSKKLWFAIEEGKPVPDSLYITLQDRRCNLTSRSNTVILPVSLKKDDTVVSINRDLVADFNKTNDSGNSKDDIALISIDKDILSAGFEETGESDLPAPVQISPENGAILDNPTRSIDFMWDPVQGAALYTVQVDCYHCCQENKWCTDIGKEYQLITDITTNSETLNYFSGKNDGKWRVWGVDSDGKNGTKSHWRMFTFKI